MVCLLKLDLPPTYSCLPTPVPQRTVCFCRTGAAFVTRRHLLGCFFCPPLLVCAFGSNNTPKRLFEPHHPAAWEAYPSPWVGGHAPPPPLGPPYFSSRFSWPSAALPLLAGACPSTVPLSLLQLACLLGVSPSDVPLVHKPVPPPPRSCRTKPPLSWHSCPTPSLLVTVPNAVKSSCGHFSQSNSSPSKYQSRAFLHFSQQSSRREPVAFYKCERRIQEGIVDACARVAMHRS